MPLLFVYGTLMRGEVAHTRLRGAPFLGAHVTEARFSLVDLGWYPGAVERGSCAVVGELYDVTDAALGEIAAYEGEEYRQVSLDTAHGRAVMFLYCGRAGSIIARGDWRKRG